MEKFQENLNEAVRTLMIADHMAYVTFPIVSEQRLILKIFDETYKSISNCINAILNYEYLYKRIQIYSENSANLETFVRKSAKRFDLSHALVKKIIEIIDLNKVHKLSAMEFVKRDKVVIMSDSLKIRILDLDTVKEYLYVAKELIKKVKVGVGA